MNCDQHRLTRIRAWMKTQGFDAFIQTHEDTYLNEYIAPDTEYLAWLTGFTGSAGIAIITAKSAFLFTDSRYTVQARHQCPESIFTHEAIESGLTLWFNQNVHAGTCLAVDARRICINTFEQWQACIEKNQACLQAITINPIDTLWTNRPQTESMPILYLPACYHGQESLEKRLIIGENLAKDAYHAALLTRTDSIAWLLNIRGHDLPCTPVLNSIALIDDTGALTLFCAPEKVDAQRLQTHAGTDVTVYPEQDFDKVLPTLMKPGQHILIDPVHTSVATYQALAACEVHLVQDQDPVTFPKACKNSVEIEGMRQAHQRDAIAMCQFLAWIETQQQANIPLNEATLAEQLGQYRSKLPLYQGPSFDTISALGPNAAMCHYNHQQTTPRVQQTTDALYLVDSGGQYLDGTTDITRTICIGPVTDEHKKYFTLVLKGHIQLARQKFPVATSGVALDAYARGPLWNHGATFGHGTGHGVGHFLNVHEGPQNISPRAKETAFYAGMIVSNEPGYYRDDAFGIRCENLMVTIPVDEPTEVPMLTFETLTLVPFDRRLIDTAYLSSSDINWLNTYHQQVWERVHTHLDAQAQAWLKTATRPL